MGIKRFSLIPKKKVPEGNAPVPAPEQPVVLEVTMPAPDMSGVVDIIEQVVNRPLPAPEVNVGVEAPHVTVNTPCKLKKWDIEFRRNNQGLTGATLTELPYDD